MPTTFPHYDEGAGALVDVDYYSTQEVAARLGLSPKTVGKYIREGRFDAVRARGGYYMTAEMIGHGAEAMIEHVHAHHRELPTGVVRLGEPVADEDLESLR